MSTIIFAKFAKSSQGHRIHSVGTQLHANPVLKTVNQPLHCWGFLLKKIVPTKRPRGICEPIWLIRVRFTQSAWMPKLPLILQHPKFSPVFNWPPLVVQPQLSSRFPDAADKGENQILLKLSKVPDFRNKFESSTLRKWQPGCYQHDAGGKDRKERHF